MSANDDPYVGFVVKRYPRYSETFVVREILAHEQAGMAVEIFSLRPSNDSHFQDLISRVKARVNYLFLPAQGLLPESMSTSHLTAVNLWRALREASEVLPDVWSQLNEIKDAEARDVYQALQLATHVRLKGIEHLHAPFASDVATIARLASRFSGVPYSFTARAKDIFHASVEPDDLRQKLQDAAGVITISDFHLEYLQSTYGSLADNVQRVYNGLDLEEFPYKSPLSRPPIILAIGRLVEKKGFSDLIDACAILARQGRGFRCRIIGAGPLAAELAEQASRLGVESFIELVGPLPQREVIQEIHAAAVLAVPCIVGKDGDRDGLPNVIQEALALGTPVVSTDVTGIPEVVRHEETGLQVPQQDPKALAAAIDRLLSDPELRLELAGEARRLIEEEFNIHRNTNRRRAIFRAAAGQNLRVPMEVG